MKAQMGRAFPTEKLDRSNIASWKYKMHQYLVGQRILGLYRRSPRKSTQLGTCRLQSLGASSGLCDVLPSIMRPWSHAWLHSRGENTKISVGQPQEDLCSQHGGTQASTSSGVDQYSTKGFVDHQLHLEDQGTVWHTWINQCQNRRWRNGANMHRQLNTMIQHDHISHSCE